MQHYYKETPQFTAYFEDESGIMYVTYQGVLSPDITAQVYKWMLDAVQTLDVKDIRGGIYDFRLVKDFNKGNLSTANRESRNFNVKVDISHVPVALLVNTFFQEQMVKVSMKIDPGQDRKRIVKSMEEALVFIKEFHRKQSKTD